MIRKRVIALSDFILSQLFKKPSHRPKYSKHSALPWPRLAGNHLSSHSVLYPLRASRKYKPGGIAHHVARFMSGCPRLGTQSEAGVSQPLPKK